MLRVPFWVVIGLLWVAVEVDAQSTGFPFLRLEASARTVALGGLTNASMGDDVLLMYDNPASLNGTMASKLALSFTGHLSDTRGGVLAYARKTNRIGLVAVGVRYFGYGSLDRTDANGTVLGSFRASDFEVSAGASREVYPNVRAGVTVNGVLSSIDDARSSAVMLDVGLHFQNTRKNMTAAVSLHNVGVTLGSFGTEEDELPLDLRVGITRQLTYLPFTVLITAFNLNDFSDDRLSFRDEFLSHIVFGGEFKLGSSLKIRLGYNHLRNQQLRSEGRLDLAGTGFGFGLALKRFNLDYGYNTWSSLGGVHQFSLQTNL